jgi:hypothetical protein
MWDPTPAQNDAQRAQLQAMALVAPLLQPLSELLLLPRQVAVVVAELLLLSLDVIQAIEWGTSQLASATYRTSSIEPTLVQDHIRHARNISTRA